MNNRAFFEALARQWEESHRDKLHFAANAEDVCLVFCLTAVARRTRRGHGSLFRSVWPQLLANGFPTALKKALLQAGLSRALDALPHINAGVSDSKADVAAILADCRARFTRADRGYPWHPDIDETDNRSNWLETSDFQNALACPAGAARLGPSHESGEEALSLLGSTSSRAEVDKDMLLRDSIRFKGLVEAIFRCLQEGYAIPRYQPANPLPYVSGNVASKLDPATDVDARAPNCALRPNSFVDPGDTAREEPPSAPLCPMPLVVENVGRTASETGESSPLQTWHIGMRGAGKAVGLELILATDALPPAADPKRDPDEQDSLDADIAGATDSDGVNK